MDFHNTWLDTYSMFYSSDLFEPCRDALGAIYNVLDETEEEEQNSSKSPNKYNWVKAD